MITARVYADRFCSIHQEELVDIFPADPENGPCPDDLENELVCFSCSLELDDAGCASLCLEHRTPLGRCLPCMFGDDDGEVMP